MVYIQKVHSEGRYLLIVACSQRKLSNEGLMPAIARYDGPIFHLLRRFLQQKPSNPPDTYILSAEFGLIFQDYPIPYYDRRMTKQRSQQLQPEVIDKLQHILNARLYPEICICVGRDYFKALEGYDTVIQSSSNVQIATGSLGKKLVKLHTWLYGKPSELNQNHSTNTLRGKACLRGVEVEMTPAQVLDAARQALTEGKGNPASYQSWYLLVDGQRVSPKWLVSYLTGLPVSSFHSSEARRMLVQLGVEVSCL
ncbi:MAG: hypothetical protein KME32_00055 [Mojavia pulchra JT2-VF2]|uniref:DUF6884 domain-containing protein n=1 Tax=Mojavia pulchra JT2-VF2 TaxID=287848 RepID=A0A951UDV3_9NOST|nr:hypothetical protein [Mojavia pulchra JT2-VF2]